MSCEFDEEQRWFRLDREGVSIVLNFADAPRTVPALGSMVLATADAAANGTAVTLSAASAAVLQH